MNYLYLYIAVAGVIMLLYIRRRHRIHGAHHAQLQESMETGMTEPPSLHPVVDMSRCMGSGACVRACPEKALGVVHGKSVLINAARCVGHGACAQACPVEAIKLVFGTAKRGVEIPNISPEFETNVAGIFIAGELGGMGLIRKACEQGRQAMDAIQKRVGSSTDCEFDVIIVGCGPAGLSAGLSALEHPLRYKILEQEESLGGTVYHYPRQKITMTTPVELAIVGRVKFAEVQKEKLLEFWQDIVRKTGLAIAFQERMESVERAGEHWVVKTSRGSYTTRTVLLAMGRRGTPRKLNVPGEDLPKVVYRLTDPAQFAGQCVLVVGGGDSALEAAIALAEQPDTRVTLSYRSAAFSRVKQKNRMMLEQQQKVGRINVMMNSKVLAIQADSVDIECDGRIVRHRNQVVIISVGGLLPTPLLQKIGIRFDTKFGSA